MIEGGIEDGGGVMVEGGYSWWGRCDGGRGIDCQGCMIGRREYI